MKPEHNSLMTEVVDGDAISEKSDRLVGIVYSFHIREPLPKDLELKMSRAHIEAILNPDPGSDRQTQVAAPAVKSRVEQEHKNGDKMDW